jgi:hypothetical protein
VDPDPVLRAESYSAAFEDQFVVAGAA